MAWLLFKCLAAMLGMSWFKKISSRAGPATKPGLAFDVGSAAVYHADNSTPEIGNQRQGQKLIRMQSTREKGCETEAIATDPTILRMVLTLLLGLSLGNAIVLFALL